MANESLQFKISSALKDIIGKDLITDDFIAVFELVKNSYDAHATRVEITFDQMEHAGRITIKDNGKGMNYSDIINKWLFVAYSAKKEGTEDDNFDYRDNLHSKKAFAGAKGIGRFSCDRLGKTLYLETTKLEAQRNTHVLYTEWEQFENNFKAEFVDINVLYDTKEKSDYGLDHGTVLVIEDLRSDWDRKKFLKLKSSLAKLINPGIGKDENHFKIFMNVPTELEEDKINDEENQVNGEVKNFIFETLGLKTTRIHSSISSSGDLTTTELRDGGTLIYRITEKNTFPLLKNLDIVLYYLNRSAKTTFTRRMGLTSGQYGHVLMYKNGFRVYPYGEPGEDPLKIDVRKAQGYSRFLGTRDLIGQIEISDPTDELKETSSRGDGLIKTKTYFQLEDFFWTVLRRLEKYVVEVQRWGLSVEDEDSFNTKSRISDLLANLTDAKNIVNFETADNFLELLEASQAESAEKIIKNLSDLAIQKNDRILVAQVEKATEKLQELQKARSEAEKEAQKEREKAQEATENLKEKISENLFLKSINTSDYQEVIALLHHVGIYAGTIDNNLKGISLRVQNKIHLSNEELNDIIKMISFETKKILNIVAFATKANFNLKTEEIEADLIEYISEYIGNIIPSITDKGMSITTYGKTVQPFVRKFKPIEMNIVVDNLINNAKKAGATKMDVRLSQNPQKKLIVEFIDNGSGIPDDNLNKIFNFGFTTTDGSGLGLYHVKEILNSLQTKITAQNNKQKGVTFKLEFK